MGLTPNARSSAALSADELTSVVYDELRQIAHRLFAHEPGNLTLQPTAVVHEAYLKLMTQTAANWQDRGHFCAVAATAMRQVLINHIRRRHADKRGGEKNQVRFEVALAADQSLDFRDLLELDEALNRLRTLDVRKASVVEMRFFAGLNMQQIAAALDVSLSSVEKDWRMARAWLSHQLAETENHET